MVGAYVSMNVVLYLIMSIISVIQNTASKHYICNHGLALNRLVLIELG
jgi:surface polysaccharide O-acyltransferase-like enzyme